MRNQGVLGFGLYLYEPRNARPQARIT